MKTTITKIDKPIPISIIRLEGRLDGSNYESLIEIARQTYATGTRDLLLDLSQMNFISSAGLAAIHQVALIFRAEDFRGQDEGWAAYHSIDRDRESGPQLHVKLLSPTKSVREVLAMTGFSELFSIFTNLQQALASFRQPALSI